MKNLFVKTFLGFAFLIGVLALALFLSAGSLDFWRAWAYLATFALCTILITAYLIQKDRALLERRVKAGPAAEAQRSQQIIQGFASLFFIGLFVVPGLDFRFHWSSIPPVVSILSDLLVALGFYIVFRVYRENTFTSATIEVADQQKVISTGPYGVVRHPMYAGAFLLLLFTPLALGSWWAELLALGVIAVIIIRLLDEERFLAVHLPGYAEYRQKVRYRLLPYIW